MTGMNTVCGVADCDRTQGAKGARGYCSRHYQRLLITGSPTGTNRTPAEVRFFGKVEPDGECWRWTAGHDQSGYGMFSDKTISQWSVRAHRWSYMHMIGEIPEGLQLDHLCRNRWCVNPWHLEPVTGAVNTSRGHDARRSNECRNGHPYNGANTYVNPKGSRVCRICSAASRKRYETKLQEAS